MFLKHRATEKLIEVLSQRDLFNPMHPSIVGRFHYGEEAQDPETFAKTDLLFISGEALPRCWTDTHYRDDEIHRHYHGRAA
ncbi:MAG: acetyltransferase [Sphingobacteriia bacterium]|nr:acetyltransferase [Sphingobacteriia bacterium]NCC38418.1 acetyltransferase [Gammaproteobacteria bacterium]